MSALPARTDDSLAPRRAPSRFVLAPALLEQAYRLAICLVRDERRAGSLCHRAMRGLSVRRPGSPVSLVRWSLLRRVLGEGRAEPPVLTSERAAREDLPDLRSLSPAQREVLALEFACELTLPECSAVLRVPQDEVQRLRREGRRRLVAEARLLR